jgi:hypothetical protein
MNLETDSDNHHCACCRSDNVQNESPSAMRGGMRRAQRKTASEKGVSPDPDQTATTENVDRRVSASAAPSP